MSRPEQLAPPEIYYNDIEARKYHNNSRIKEIQAEMTVRALELLDIHDPSFILDIGCGSGLSGEICSEADHIWVGMDVSADMLSVALEKDCEGDLLWADIGNGIPFRAGTFDAAISISAIQWLCNADDSSAEPKHRLLYFFQTLYSALKSGGKVCAQFYPLNQNQSQMIVEAALKAGFGGGIVVDNPESKKAKHYLCLVAGPASLNLDGVQLPASAAAKKKIGKGSKQWILDKKDSQRGKGKVVKNDSKFTGRRRRVRF